jgi:putative flippase GtrA
MGVWAKRFMGAAIIQGLLAVILTLAIIFGQMYVKPEVSRVIAFGSAGMWFTMGYIMYILVGVIGVGVSALFYHYLEYTLATPYKGIAKYLAMLHLVMMNVGIAGSTWLMMYGGYNGAKAMLPVEVGGLGLNAAAAHEILAPLIMPIAAFIIILVAGIIAGGVGFIVTYRRVEATIKK